MPGAMLPIPEDILPPEPLILDIEEEEVPEEVVDPPIEPIPAMPPPVGDELLLFVAGEGAGTE